MSKFFIKQAFAEAMDLQKNGRLSEAKEIYLKILNQSPNDANALHLISLIFMAEGSFEEVGIELQTLQKVVNTLFIISKLVLGASNEEIGLSLLVHFAFMYV